MNECYQFKQTEADNTDILIYGDIRKSNLFDAIFGEDGSRTDAMSFTEALKAVATQNVTVRINSYGGSVSEGLAIFNQLKNCGKNVITVCDGFACSAASVIFCAGATRIQPKTALLMIHNAWTEGGQGNANHFRKLAEDLEKITAPSVEAYKMVSNLPEEEIKRLMDEETWITAEEALNWGFATEVPEEEAQQSLEQGYVASMVSKMKEYQKELAELKSAEANHEPKSSWKHFF